MTVRILNGDCREVLKALPAESVHCCVTSPPYWGLRDYGVAGQIGLEPTFDQFVSEMVQVFREVRRVLRKDGTLWLNLGDSYAGGGRGGNPEESPHRKQATNAGSVTGITKNPWPLSSLKPKDLCGIPWRVAFALQADGWWLRQDLIWAKPNPMPESVTDRCTKAHEYLFLLTKAERYYYDAEAIREAHSDPNVVNGVYQGKGGVNKPDWIPETQGWNGGGLKMSSRAYNSAGRNKRSVWEVATAPFAEAHFATFPPALIEPCILAGTSEKGCCRKCGAPWVRETKATFTRQQDVNADDGVRGAGEQKPMDASNGWQGFPRGTTSRETLGWSPSCQCNAAVAPCTVLDPFGGAGTTGLVADRLQRNAIIIELNPSYAAMASTRIHNDAPLFSGVAAE